MQKAERKKPAAPAIRNELVDAFFSDRIVGRPETGWEVHDLSADEHSWGNLNPARMDALACLQGRQRVVPTDPRIASYLQGVLVAVTHFAQGGFLSLVEPRFRKLEVESQETRDQLQSLCMWSGFTKSKQRTTASEVKLYLTLLRECFKIAFGSDADIVIADSDDLDYSVTVLFDASKADSRNISQARLGGGRGKFYDKIIHEMPHNVLDSVDFTFVFPAP